MELANHCYEKRKAIYMSFREFSVAQGAPSKVKLDNGSKGAKTTDHPAAKPNEKTVEIAHSDKL